MNGRKNIPILFLMVYESENDWLNIIVISQYLNISISQYHQIFKRLLALVRGGSSQGQIQSGADPVRGGSSQGQIQESFWLPLKSSTCSYPKGNLRLRFVWLCDECSRGFFYLFITNWQQIAEKDFLTDALDDLVLIRAVYGSGTNMYAFDDPTSRKSFLGVMFSPNCCTSDRCFYVSVLPV